MELHIYTSKGHFNAAEGVLNDPGDDKNYENQPKVLETILTNEEEEKEEEDDMM